MGRAFGLPLLCGAMTVLTIFLLLPSPLSAQSYRINTIAGSRNTGDGALASTALALQPTSVLADDKGGFYFFEVDESRIRYVNDQGRLSTIAGVGFPRAAIDGLPANINFINGVISIKLSPAGELHFVDRTACRISKIDNGGIVRHVAGTGTCGFNGDGRPALSTNINRPGDIVFDRQGLLLFADRSNNRVRRIAPSGIVETILGTGSDSFSPDNGSASVSTIVFPSALAVHPDGSIFVGEAGYRRVRRFTPGGNVVTITGDGFEGNSGDGGPALLARFGFIASISLDSVRNRLYISDFFAHRVRVVDLASGLISAFAGRSAATGGFAAPGFSGDGGPAVSARFNAIFNLSVDRTGALLLSDSGNDRIRKVENNIISTIAGRPPNIASGVSALNAELRDPRLIPGLPGGDSLIVDRGNKVLHRLSPNGIVTNIAGAPISTTSTGDGGPPASATFTAILGVAIDAGGKIYVNDNQRLRIIDGTTISSASFSLPPNTSYILVDSPRNRIFSLQEAAYRIQVADLTLSQPVWRNFAGNGTAGFSGDNGQAADARLSDPTDMVLDEGGNLYVADLFSIRKVNPAGIISTVAGSGRIPTTTSPVEGVALQVPISPYRIALNRAGTLLTLTEVFGPTIIRQIQLNTGQIRRIAGLGLQGYSGDGGPALSATLRLPSLISTDSAGSIYFTELVNATIRVLTPIVVTNAEIVSGDNQFALVSTRLANPLVLRVLNGTAPVEFMRVSFTATGGATVPASAITGPDGQVNVAVTLGPTPGPVTITAQIDGLANIAFRATATSAPNVNPNRPAIRASGGVVTAGAFGANPTISSGSWIEIYGSNLSNTTRSWDDADFRGPQAPTELDGVRVSINNRPAFVAFISPNQINVQVPDAIAAVPATITVTNSNGVSEEVSVTAAVSAPGILAPAVFLVNNVQYAAALHQDGAFVGAPGLIAGANFRPARAGDVITLYGVGFGATSPAQSSGQVVSALASLPSLAIRMGTADAIVQFGGLAPGAIGLFQFNIIVPLGLQGNVPLTITLNGARLQQALTLTTSTE